MNLIVVSPPLLLSPPRAYGGIEKEAFLLANTLGKRGHRILLLAKEGSQAPHNGFMYPYEDENQLPSIISEIWDNEPRDVILDFTHNHTISVARPDLPQINNLQVMSVMGSGLNTVFISRGQKAGKFQGVEGPVIYYGLDFSEYPLYTGPRDDYLLYLGQIIEEKRIEWACEIALATGHPLKVFGPWWGSQKYMDMLHDYEKRFPQLISMNSDIGGQEKIEILQHAYALVHPVGALNWCEAGAIVVLEALAVGTPCLVSDNGCLPEYVDATVGCCSSNIEVLKQAVPRMANILPSECRKRAEQFSDERMAIEYEQLAEKVMGGLRWNVK